MKLPLKLKVVTENTIIVVFFAAIIVWAIYSMVLSALTNSKKDLVVSNLVGRQQQLNASFSEMASLTRLISRNEKLKAYLLSPSKTGGASYLIDYFDKSKESNIYVMDLTGKVILSVDPSFVNNNFAFRDYFKNSLLGKESSELALGVLTKKAGFYFSSPIFDTNKVIGMVVVKSDIDMVLSNLSGPFDANGGYYFITDKNGIVIETNKNVPRFSSLGKIKDEVLLKIGQDRTYENILIKPLQYDKLLEVLATTTDVPKVLQISDSQDDDDELMSMVRIGNYPFYLVTETGMSSVFAQERKILIPIVVIMIVSVSVGILIQYLLFSRLFLPLTKLEKFSKDVAENISTIPVNIKTGDEIETLSNSLYAMVSRLKSSNESLKETVESKTKDLTDNLTRLANQNKEMDENERAMINLLEDAHNLEKQLADEKNSVEEKVKQRTEELIETIARFQSAINSVPRAFVVVDSNSKVIFLNDKLETILNKKVEKWTVAMIDKLVGKEVEIAQKINEVMKTAGVVNYRDVMYGNKYLSIYISPVLARDGRPLGAVMTIDDVTERAILERSKDEFFSIASHELRTPLTAIRGNTSMIQEYYKDQIKDPELSSMISDIHDSSVRLIDIVNDFLNISRLEQGKMEFKKETFNINDVVISIIKEYSESGLNKDIKINYAAVVKSPPVVADEGKVKQVLVNLIGNALKFTSKGKIDISVVEESEALKIVVADTGRGIPEKQQSLLFRKFQQTGESLFTRDTVGGTGLGLYISKKIVEGMGGKIKLERSTEGKGSVFSFTIPIAK